MNNSGRIPRVSQPPPETPGQPHLLVVLPEQKSPRVRRQLLAAGLNLDRAVELRTEERKAFTHGVTFGLLLVVVVVAASYNTPPGSRRSTW